MNTYNENLRSSVLATLSSQELELSNLNAGFVTSEVSLYYAEGAAIRAAYKLDTINERYEKSKIIFDTVVVDHNIAVNVNADGDHFKESNALSVTNMAVAAANMQASSNAILRLARTVAGIHSITNAADYGQEIFTQSKLAHRLMKVTAYDAGLASEAAMDASGLIAEVAASTVATEAKAVNDLLGGLEKVLTDNFDAISAEVDSTSKQLAEAVDEEKESEGVAEMVKGEYFAAQHAFLISNNELNLGLQAGQLGELNSKKLGSFVPLLRPGKKQYYVLFESYKSPFKFIDPKSDTDKAEIEKEEYNPVESYHIILVKNRSKSIFSIADAEAVILEKDRSITVKPFLSGSEENKRTILVSILQHEILDADGEQMNAGQNYVVFILVVLKNDYKKMINNYNDYLTAPSANFKLTTKLKSPAASTIKVTPRGPKVLLDVERDIKLGKAGELDVEVDLIITDSGKKGIQKLTFDVKEDVSSNVEYRCMFLPVELLPKADMLTDTGLRDFEKEMEWMEEVKKEFSGRNDELVTKREITVRKMAKTKEELKQKEKAKGETDLPAEVKKTKGSKTTEQDAEIEYLQNEIDGLIVEIETIEAQLEMIARQKKEASSKPRRYANSSPGFIFNLKLAELVPRPNYHVAEPGKEANKATGKEQEEQGNKEAKKFELVIEKSFTDNFGNPLRKDRKYKPLVFSYYNDEIKQDQYINSISNINDTEDFTFLEFTPSN